MKLKITGLLLMNQLRMMKRVIKELSLTLLKFIISRQFKNRKREARKLMIHQTLGEKERTLIF